jgi:hypothetical protein
MTTIFDPALRVWGLIHYNISKLGLWGRRMLVKYLASDKRLQVDFLFSDLIYHLKSELNAELVIDGTPLRIPNLRFQPIRFIRTDSGDGLREGGSPASEIG